MPPPGGTRHARTPRPTPSHSRAQRPRSALTPPAVVLAGRHPPARYGGSFAAVASEYLRAAAPLILVSTARTGRGPAPAVLHGNAEYAADLAGGPHRSFRPRRPRGAPLSGDIRSRAGAGDDGSVGVGLPGPGAPPRARPVGGDHAARSISPSTSRDDSGKRKHKPHGGRSPRPATGALCNGAVLLTDVPSTTITEKVSSPRQSRVPEPMGEADAPRGGRTRPGDHDHATLRHQGLPSLAGRDNREPPRSSSSLRPHRPAHPDQVPVRPRSTP